LEIIPKGEKPKDKRETWQKGREGPRDENAPADLPPNRRDENPLDRDLLALPN